MVGRQYWFASYALSTRTMGAQKRTGGGCADMVGLLMKSAMEQI
jgi:hypothetical protein